MAQKQTSPVTSAQAFRKQFTGESELLSADIIACRILDIVEGLQ